MIRRAGYQDIHAIATLIRAHYDATGFPQEIAYDEFVVITSIGGMLDDPRHFALFVAEEDGVVVGVLCMQKITASFFTSDTAIREMYLYIRPEHRGKSLGTGMIALAEEWGRSEGIHCIVIGNHPLSPPHVAATYERHGYREAQTDFIKRL